MAWGQKNSPHQKKKKNIKLDSVVLLVEMLVIAILK
jgi:hypothetical protein